MMTVHQVSQLSGVSVRALHHYDAIGLLPASAVTEAGYRLYGDEALERLQMILLFRELQFPLKDIGAILDNPHFDRGKALAQQIELLKLRKEHLEAVLALAEDLQQKGTLPMYSPDFNAFDTAKMDQYAAQAKASWGDTEAYKEFEQKAKDRTSMDESALAKGLMDIFKQFGDLEQKDPSSEEAQRLVAVLQQYITDHFYTCTDEILRALGQMYDAGGDMTDNIDRYAGEGTAAFVRQAIEARR